MFNIQRIIYIYNMYYTMRHIITVQLFWHRKYSDEDFQLTIGLKYDYYF